jgi:hypothetical protein
MTVELNMRDGRFPVRTCFRTHNQLYTTHNSLIKDLIWTLIFLHLSGVSQGAYSCYQSETTEEAVLRVQRHYNALEYQGRRAFARAMPAE